MAEGISQLVRREEFIKNLKAQPNLSEAEEQHRKLVLNRIERARDQREQRYEELDGLTYEEDYIFNRRMKNSYLTHRKNDNEPRITTGTTEKKVEVVQNELLNINPKQQILAYNDEDDEIDGLGKDFEDITRRTDEQENEEDQWPDAIDELLTQRAVFYEEVAVDRIVYDKQLKRDVRIIRPEKRLLSGLQVFLGDITMPAYRFNQQPYIVKYDRMTYEEAETIYKGFDNWKYVKPGGASSNKWYEGAFKWRMGIVQNHEVEVVHYMSHQDDEYQIFINGVMMLPVGTSLPWEKEGYNITMVILKPMSREFAYGKSLVASAKILQALDTETIRLLITKFRQAVKPPKGVKKKGRVYSKDIFAPGAMTQGISKSDMETLVDHDGVTQADMAMWDAIKKEIETFIGQGNIGQGLAEKGSQTAREIIELRKQAIKMLGLAVLSFLRLKRNLTELRIYNILEMYSKPIDSKFDPFTKELVDVYKKFTVQHTELERGRTGKKVIQFSNKSLGPDEKKNMLNLEDAMERRGKMVRFRNVNIKKLREFKTFWYIVIVPESKDSHELEKVMFEDKLKTGVAVSRLAGRPLNGDKLVDMYERIWDAPDMFQMAPPQNEMMGPGGEGAGGQGGQANELLKQIEQFENETGGAGQEIAPKPLNPQSQPATATAVLQT